MHRVTSSTTHNLVIPPTAVPGGDASTRAWEALYPLGSINPGNKAAPHGGFGFYMHGPKQFAEALKRLGDGEEVALGYDVLFQDGFEWVKGGKLPGICEYSVRTPYLRCLMPTTTNARRWRSGRSCVRMHRRETERQVQVL